MQVHTFIVDSALEAVEQVRAKLGPDAVVLSVRRLPADGLSKLWKKPRIEVLAAAPAPEVAAPPPQAAPAAVPSASSAVPQGSGAGASIP
jgi:flagellar biosynthesis protein FlhF